MSISNLLTNNNYSVHTNNLTTVSTSPPQLKIGYDDTHYTNFNTASTGFLTIHNTNDSITFSNTADSTDVNDGSVVFLGGVGISKRLNCTGPLTVKNVINATYNGDPTPATEGDIVYNTSTHKLQVYTNIGWQNLTVGA